MTAWQKTIAVTKYNFKRWHRNPRIFITFALALVLCFMLTNKAMKFSEQCATTMQLVEAFVWTFGDSQSILLASLLLVLLFADMPFLSPITPYYLARCTRMQWLAGQILYILAATGIYLLFVLAATCVLCMSRSFIGNQWSETAAILGYSGAGREVALPILVRTLERSDPYSCMAAIFSLMLLYSLLMVSIMLLFNLKKGAAAGIGGAFVFSLYGFLLNPQTLQSVFQLSDERMYQANVAVGWLSPLNHATYHMHNFGYDLLPKLWQSYLLFILLIGVCTGLSLVAMRRYNFNFAGSEG